MRLIQTYFSLYPQTQPHSSLFSNNCFCQSHFNNEYNYHATKPRKSDPRYLIVSIDVARTKERKARKNSSSTQVHAAIPRTVCFYVELWLGIRKHKFARWNASRLSSAGQPELVLVHVYTLYSIRCTLYQRLNGVRSSRNSRLFPELNPRRSAGGAFCLGARSSRDLVSNNAMPGASSLSTTASTLFLCPTDPFSRRPRSIFQLPLAPRRPAFLEIRPPPGCDSCPIADAFNDEGNDPLTFNYAPQFFTQRRKFSSSYRNARELRLWLCRIGFLGFGSSFRMEESGVKSRMFIRGTWIRRRYKLI